MSVEQMSAAPWEDVYCHACGGGLGTLNDDVRAALDTAFRAGRESAAAMLRDPATVHWSREDLARHLTEVTR